MNIILADDSGLLRESFAALLERQGFRIIAQCSNANDVMGLVDEHANDTDLLVTDVRMPPTMSDDGLRAATKVHRKHPIIGIVVCSQYVAPSYARTVLEMADQRAGIGYVLKDSVGHVADFIKTLKTVAAGGTVVDPQVTEAMMRSHSGLSRLTPREEEVLGLMAHGASNADIADRLVISSAAVAKHIASIFQKLDMPPNEDNRRVKVILAYLANAGF